jgi:tRNA threonylcarbamoyladenosine biosynthesis protein TsaE
MLQSNNEYISKSAEETKSISKLIISKLRGGTVIALSGDLGSGKTTFVKGVARELCISDTISSPTFVIIKEYNTKLPNRKSSLASIKKLVHIDCYRLKSYKDAINLGISDYFDNDFLTIIEWPEKIKEILPIDTILIKFQYLSKDKRKITVINNKKQKAKL